MPQHPILSSAGPGALASTDTRAPALVSLDGKTFPLRSVELRSHAEGGLAESRLSQTWANPHDEPLEVLYTMPLPADGAVVGYTVRMGDRVIEGEVRTREDAREAYREALEQGRTAGLLEQARDDTFVQKLGSLPAGVEAEIEIRVLHPLAFLPAAEAEEAEPAAWEFRFPTVVGVRYQGEPGRVPDRADLDPDRGARSDVPTRVALRLTVGGLDAGRTPRSPSHDIRVEPSANGCAVTLDGASRLDRDIVVAWDATGERLDARLIEGGGLPGDDGRYALLTVTPPTRAEATLSRDLTVLIDASGSMSGEPLLHCKSIARALLESLDSEDRFELLAFASSVETLVGGPSPATPRMLKRAARRLDALRAGGATEMTGAMVAALSPLRPDSQRQVILLTDGFIGFEREVIGEVRRRLQPGCALHVVGIGAAPNRTLTRGLARAGGGVELFAGDTSSAADAASRLLQATVGPVLTDLRVGGSARIAQAPARPACVLAGQPAVVALELAESGGEIELEARLAGSDEPWVRVLSVPPRSEAGGPGTSPLSLGALYGREAIADVELATAAALRHQRRDQADSTVKALGLRHRIASSRTSLVAVCDEPTVDPREPRRRRRLEVELPAGVSAEMAGVHLIESSRFDSRVRGVVGLEGACFRRVADLCVDEEYDFSLMDAIEPPRPIRARPFRVDGDLLVLELQADVDPFELPYRARWLVVTGDGGEEIEVRFVEERSSHRGPHAAGLTLRLALRRSDGKPWRPGRFAISWQDRSRRSHRVFFEIPDDAA